MVDAISTASTLQSNAAESSATLTENFDTFLTLLTAQLQNQDPLQPVDSTEFTNQLVQFSGVEQQIATNDALGDLIAITASSTAASLSGYLGQNVVVDSATAELQSGQINWKAILPEGVESAIASVQSETGQIVYSETLSPRAGEQDFSWSGTTIGGRDLTDGTYSLVVRAEDAAGEVLTVPIQVATTVNGVDLSGSTTSLSTTSGTFSFDKVLQLTQPTS